MAVAAHPMAEAVPKAPVMASVDTLKVQVYGVDEMASAAEPASGAGATRTTSATSAASEPSVLS